LRSLLAGTSDPGETKSENRKHNYAAFVVSVKVVRQKRTLP
jgi:hypothetical protein